MQIFQDDTITWILGLNPTSFRHAQEYCMRVGGNLISLTSQDKIDRVLSALHVRRSASSAPKAITTHLSACTVCRPCC